MDQPYKPWVGTGYKKAEGLLILSESAYCWDNGDGRCLSSHPTDHTVKFWALSERFETRNSREARDIVAITRALAQTKSPTAAERAAAWAKVAYSIYVQRRMEDLHQRPNGKDFSDSSEHFIRLLEQLRPGRVVITSLTTWRQMPPTQMQIDNYKQAYRLKYGTLVWCLAVPHPASRRSGFGFKWSDIGQRIVDFKAEVLPRNIASNVPLAD